MFHESAGDKSSANADGVLAVRLDATDTGSSVILHATSKPDVTAFTPVAPRIPDDPVLLVVFNAEANDCDGVIEVTFVIAGVVIEYATLVVLEVPVDVDGDGDRLLGNSRFELFGVVSRYVHVAVLQSNAVHEVLLVGVSRAVHLM